MKRLDASSFGNDVVSALHHNRLQRLRTESLANQAGEKKSCYLSIPGRCVSATLQQIRRIGVALAQPLNLRDSK